VKLHQAGALPANSFTGYGEHYVIVSGRRHESSVVVLPDQVLDWNVKSFEALTTEDFSILQGHGVEIVLLGTGARQRFPHPRLTAELARAGIGVEVMDVQAACRTYNILVAEERKVAAALLIE
jgi:uncharacterized protein